MMGISYAIPALQLVLKYQDETEETGNQDICYYNFQCSFPLGGLTDFNHFLSNIGYVGFGLTFLIITKYKSWKYRINQLSNIIETENGSFIIHKVEGRSKISIFCFKIKISGHPSAVWYFLCYGGSSDV